VTVGALTFNETFDGPLDLSVWALNYFGETGVNGVTCDPANVAVENGSCSLTLSSPTVGACITTNPAGGPSVGFQFGYGFVEYRAWFPNNGVFSDWAAVWTSSQDWPSTGEIDIAESLQGNLTSNYHSVNGANNMAISGNWTGWTTFGVNRRVGVNDVYWGGRLVRSYQTFDDGAPHYLIANVGNGQDNPLVVGAALKLSYVRYWLPV
jgi:hypothetical protein